MMLRNKVWVGFTIGLILIAVATWLRQYQGPYYLLENIDPSYQYLTSALNILDGHSPRHTDHPGTTLQTLGAGVILVVSFFKSFTHTNDVFTDVLTHPEEYLLAINSVVLLMLGIAMSLCLRQAWALTHSRLTVVSLGLLPLLLFQATNALWQVSPEPLLLAVVYATFFVCLPGLYAHNISNKVLGALLGFGMATKVTFFPWLMALWLLPNWKSRFKGFGWCLLSFIICTSPIWARYKFMIKWNLAVLKHSGNYGHGDVGLPSVTSLFENATTLFKQASDFFVLFFGAALILWLHRANHTRSHLKTGLLFLSMAALQFLITLKHPGARYLLPTLMGLGMWVSLQLSRAEVRPYALMALLAVLGLNGWQLMHWKAQRTQTQEQVTAIHTAVQNLGACLEIRSYSLNPTLGLQFGNQWNGGFFSQQLKTLYPHEVFYEFTHDAYWHFGEQIHLAQVAKEAAHYPCVVFETFRVDTTYPHMILKPISLPPGPLELYQVTAFKPKHYQVLR